MEKIEKIISALLEYHNIDEANIGKRNEGFIVHFHEYGYDEDVFVSRVEDIRHIINNIRGFLVIGGCNNTLHIAIFTKVIYSENEQTIYLEVSTGRVVKKYGVSEEQASRIANRIGLEMHTL